MGVIFDGGPSAIAFGVAFNDCGVVDDAIDRRDGHGGIPDQCKTPLSLMDWCLKFGLFPPVTLCLTRSYPCSPCGQLEGRSLCW